LEVEIVATRAREEVYGIQDRDADQEDLDGERLNGRSMRDPRDKNYRTI
jgi:hypothetical protein